MPLRKVFFKNDCLTPLSRLVCKVVTAACGSSLGYTDSVLGVCVCVCVDLLCIREISRKKSKDTVKNGMSEFRGLFFKTVGF